MIFLLPSQLYSMHCCCATVPGSTIPRNRVCGARPAALQRIGGYRGLLFPCCWLHPAETKMTGGRSGEQQAAPGPFLAAYFLHRNLGINLVTLLDRILVI